MKPLIVYYSMSGNTAYAAEALAAQLNADTLRLEPETAYPDRGLKKFFWGGKSAVMAETPPLRPYVFEPQKYDRILFGFPVWAGTIAPPLRTFVRDNASALSDQPVAAFACQSGAGGEKALARLETLLGRPLAAKCVLTDPKTKPATETKAQLRAFGDACKANGSHL